ncbi:MAG: peptidoglycan DD-metalloendopeptidase family protein [Sediminibacterium sp.]|nr:peptidoglycan DD-metalloendopeptidase family protein [Sediminibacterium sp.]
MAIEAIKFEEWLRVLKHPFSVVPFNRGVDRLLAMDFTEKNTLLTADTVSNIDLFTNYIDTTLQTAKALYGIGGYNELRSVYSRSEVFDGVEGKEPRRLHLGIDIWGAAGTFVLAPLTGKVHSFAFNKAYGDYGATIILEHTIGEGSFYTLYGHLSLDSITQLQVGDEIQQQKIFARFGIPEENGYWPPHLHFQLILDMGDYAGDYPGVCAYSERGKYLANCPDPDPLIGMIKFAI